MSEDFKFMVDAILVSNNIGILGEELYVYRSNADSVTSVYKSNVHRDMLAINKWIENNICQNYPDLRRGLNCCCVETYIVAIQNLCNPGSPFNYLERICIAWRIKQVNKYEERITCALRCWEKLPIKKLVVLLMLGLYLEPLYIFLFSIKRKTFKIVSRR